MKVLHVYKTYYPESYGGVQQVIKQISAATNKKGVKNTVLCLSKMPDPKKLYDANTEVIRFPLDFEIASTGFSKRCFFEFEQYSREADIIHYHFPWPFADLMHFYAKVDKPSLLTYHSDIVRQKFLLKFYKPLMHQFLKRMYALVATSPNYFASSPILQKYKEKVKIIPIGLDQSLYPEPESTRMSYWRQKLNYEFFLFVGVLRPYKGLHVLLDACQGTNFKVVIVGTGPLEKKLQSQALKLRLDNILFFGALPDDDKVALLKLCKAIVFPSHMRSEAFGVSLLEGAMYSKPLITSEMGTGSSYVNLNNKTGFIVPPENPLALRNAMQEILQGSPEIMGQNARLRFEELFTADKMAEGYFALYNQMLSI